MWRPDLDAKALAGLAGTRTYPLRSSFRPSYNMAVNLVGQFGRARAAALLESSFAQFQADRAGGGPGRAGPPQPGRAGRGGGPLRRRRLRPLPGPAPGAEQAGGRPV